MKTNRLNWIDSAKGLLILLVVLGHMSDINGELKNWIFTFHMPAFFIISGFLFSRNNDKDKSIKVFIKKKIKGIAIPYFWFSLFSIIYNLVSGLIKVNGIKPALVCVFETFSTLGIYTLWFLPTLFFTCVLVYIVFHFLSDIITIVISFCLFAVSCFLSFEYDILSSYGLILHTITLVVGRIFLAFPLFVLGFFIYKIYEKIKIRKGILLFVGMLLLVLNVLLYLLFRNVVDLCTIKIGNPIIYILGTITGTIGILCLCYVHSFKIMEFFGKNSLIIMATHVNLPFFDIANRVISLLFTINSEILHSSFVYIFTVLFELIAIFIINRFLPFIVGKNKSR